LRSCEGEEALQSEAATSYILEGRDGADVDGTKWDKKVTAQIDLREGGGRMMESIASINVSSVRAAIKGLTNKDSIQSLWEEGRGKR